MMKHFIDLQWKSFFRSASLGKGIALKVVTIFFGIYMLVSMVLLGGGLFFILKEAVPEVDPMITINKYMIYWVLFEMMFRYLMQKLPVMDIKPLLILPIKKRKVINYILGRSLASFYNGTGLFLFIPFSIALLINGYPAMNVLAWLFSIISLIVGINFINFIINKSDKAFIVIVSITAILVGLEYFGLAPVLEYAGKLFYTLYQYPIALIVTLAIAVGSYWVNFNYLKNRLFLDASLKRETKIASTSELAWTRRFGDIAPFLQLDLRLIWRNKRTKTQVFMSLLMVFYGLIFYTSDTYSSFTAMFVIVGILITGIFLSNFGQFIPAWDSAYYGMMMSQNIPLRKYLESKAGLISVSIFVMFLISIPYVYFGWEALAINFACALYNLGVNIPVVLFFGSMNKKRIDLNKSAFGNMQGTSATQFLIMLPVLVLPMLIYLLFAFLISSEVGLIVLSLMGITGFLLRKMIMDRITELYRKKKYGMIAGFKQKDS